MEGRQNVDRESAPRNNTKPQSTYELVLVKLQRHQLFDDVNQ